MKTIQMTLDEDLVKEVDQIVEKLNTTRSAFTRDALRAAVRNYAAAQLEKRHRRGYERHPVGQSEFTAWENEHAWGEL